MKTYSITPVPAPRMVRSDKWKKRPCVMRYFAFRDEVKAHGVQIPQPCKVVFWMPMPPSWSAKKRKSMNERPHLAKPDADNLTKALLDSVFGDDAHIWSIWAEKRWAYDGKIEIKRIPV